MKSTDTTNSSQDVQWWNLLAPNMYQKLSENHLPADSMLARINSFAHGCRLRLAYDLEKRESFKSYEGKFRFAFGWVIFDFDGKQRAVDQARELLRMLGITDALVFYSGNKGVHVYIPQNYFLAILDENFLARFTRAMRLLKNEKFDCLDDSIYRPNHLIRVEGSRHEKSGHFKTLVATQKFIDGQYSWEDLQALGMQTPTFTMRSLADDQNALPLPSLFEDLLSRAVVPVKQGRIFTDDEIERFATVRAKPCVQNMLDRRAVEGDRHQTALVIVTHYYKTARHKSDVERVLRIWCNRNEWDEAEAQRMIDAIYSGNHDYSFGCTNAQMAKHCSARCRIYRKLDESIRPQADDRDLVDLDDKKTEHDVAVAVLDDFDGDLVRCKTSLFKYDGQVWKSCADADLYEIEQAVKAKYDFKCTQPKIKATMRQLLALTPECPRNLHEPLAAKLCLNNGTLEFVKGDAQHWGVEFREHRREDWITNAIALDYNPNAGANEMLKSFIERLTTGSADQQEKIRAIKQMFGALIYPVHPRLFLVHGPGETGKSTLTKLAMRLINEENYSAVELNKMEGFSLNSMLGKIANINTDIDLNQTINDANVKKIEDRTPVQIERKFRDDVIAPLPAVHIFVGNGIPRTKEGASGAHSRRWTFIELNNRLSTQAEGLVRDYDAIIFNSNPAGVLNFAIAGALDVLANGGKYLNPESGRLAVENWLAGADYVGEFLEELKESPVAIHGISLDERAIGSKREIVTGINSWLDDRKVPPHQRPRRSEIISILKLRGFNEDRTADHRGLRGLKIAAAPF